MVELVLVACLLKQPQHCDTFRLPFAEEMALPQCVWQSQLKAAQWSAGHPDWIVRKMTCERPRA